MILPNIPAKLDKRTNQINRFLGLNWTENYTVGELRDSAGLSSDKYPCMSQRDGHTVVEAGTIATIYEWNNHLVKVLADGTLKIDNTTITTLSTGDKQFAVINNTMVILPDMVMIDLEDMSLTGPMSDAISIPSSIRLSLSSVNGKEAAWTDSHIRTTYISELVAMPDSNPFEPTFAVGTSISGLYGYFYGFDPDAVEACFHDGEWDYDRLEALKKTYAIGYDPVALDANEQIADYPCYMRNMILILGADKKVVLAGDAPLGYTKEGLYWFAPGDTNQPPITYLTPTKTQYAVSANTVMRSAADYSASTVATITSSDILYYAGNANDSDWAYLKVTQNNTDYTGYVPRSSIFLRSVGYQYPQPSLSATRQKRIAGISPFADAYLHEGYKVNITGTKYGLYDKDGAVIVSATPNKLTFADGTLDGDIKDACVVGDNGAIGSKSVTCEGVTYTFTTTEVMAETDVLYMEPFMDTTKIYVWDQSTKTIKKEYALTEATLAETTFTLERVVPNVNGTVVISKDIPALDYICESNNRLWGASNTDKTIYASALGDPTDWWSTGLDDSSYQLAVASEDPFTGIIEYGGAVLAWKEFSLVKILGGYPSQYYSNEYQYAGVQAGCHDSMRIINGILYYKGTHGFYSYSSTPVLISERLGDPNITAEHAGSDGKKYYCSVTHGTGHMVLVYDIEKGLWLKESEDQVDGWGYLTNTKTMVFLKEGDIVKYDPSSTERVDWNAEFCTFIEGTTNNSVWTVLMGRKGYTKLILFADMAEDSFIRIEIKEDNKPWREAYSKVATYPLLFRVPIRLGRCAKVALRLSGRGDVTLRAINREYVAGSDK